MKKFLARFSKFHATNGYFNRIYPFKPGIKDYLANVIIQFPVSFLNNKNRNLKILLYDKHELSISNSPGTKSAP